MLARPSLLAAICSTVLVLSACTPPGGGDDDGADAGSVLNVGWNDSFFSLNTSTSTGSAVTNAVVAYMMNDNFVHYEEGLELAEGALGTVEQVSKEPLQVEYSFADSAQWSDGTPVDAADLVLQWAATSGNFNTAEPKLDEQGNILESDEGEVSFDAGRIGPSLIEEYPEVSQDATSVTFTYSRSFSDWDTTFGLGGDGVGVPAHIVAKKALGIDDPNEGKQAIMEAVESKDVDSLSAIADFWNTGFNFTSMPDDTDLLVHSGPYAMTDFAEGQFLSLTRDDAYTGPIDPNIETVTFRYNEDPMAMVQAIENGEVDLSQPQAVADVRSAVDSIDGIEVVAGDDASFEHVDLTFDNNGPFDPAAYGGDEDAARAVRQAFLMSLPRQDIVDRLIAPLSDDAARRDSFMAVPGSPIYDEVATANGSDTFPGGDVDGAKAVLAEAGVESPTVRILYGASNSRRAQQFQLIRESAEAAGFEIIDDGDDDWGTRLGDGTYDAALFAWQPLTTAVTENDSYYREGSQYNYGGYSNDAVDSGLDALLEAEGEAEQAEALANVETTLFEDGFGAPLYQHPALLIHSDRVENVSLLSVLPGPVWNYWDWDVN